GMAEYMTVPAHHFVPLGDADPVAAAPLSDAGLTPYHAIKESLPHLAGGGRYALAIGLGGVGRMGMEIIRVQTGGTGSATDVKEEARAGAESDGAVTVGAGEDQVERMRALSGGRGVVAAFDVVGAIPTLVTAMAGMVKGGRCILV